MHSPRRKNEAEANTHAARWILCGQITMVECCWRSSSRSSTLRVGTGYIFFFQAEDGIRAHCVTGVQTCGLPIFLGIIEWREHELDRLGVAVRYDVIAE